MKGCPASGSLFFSAVLAFKEAKILVQQGQIDCKMLDLHSLTYEVFETLARFF